MNTSKKWIIAVGIATAITVGGLGISQAASLDNFSDNVKLTQYRGGGGGGGNGGGGGGGNGGGGNGGNCDGSGVGKNGSNAARQESQQKDQVRDQQKDQVRDREQIHKDTQTTTSTEMTLTANGPRGPRGDSSQCPNYGQRPQDGQGMKYGSKR